MKPFDFIVIGGGIAGLISAYLLRDFKTLLIDEKGILEGASKAAGAFLFPKVGFNTSYTKFINDGIVEALNFYQKLGINTNKKGVLILPRDEKDIEKFKKYEKEITLPFKKIDNGFYFEDGGVIEVEEVKEKIEVEYEIKKIDTIYKEDLWIVNGYKTKNIILATGVKNLIDIPYIKIRPIWGERIEGESEYKELKYHFHKNCSLAVINQKTKIGATHKRDYIGSVDEKEVKTLLKKANEILEIKNFKLENIIGGYRAASIDYFPIVGKIIEVNKTLNLNPKIIKGELPKEVVYIDGLYIINGMGARGFSNAYLCAKKLRDYILYNRDLGAIDSKRLFIKWARKEGEKYVKSREGY